MSNWNILPQKIEGEVSKYLSLDTTDSRMSEYDFRLGVKWAIDNIENPAISLIEKRIEELIDYNELSATHGAIKDHQLILERIKEL